MKNILITVILISTCWLGFTQEDEIIPLSQLGAFDEEINKTYYYKDIDGDLNKLVGTWVYDDGTHYFKIEFFKRINHRFGGMFIPSPRTFDYIYSKYIYKLNEVTVYNTYNFTNAIDKDVKEHELYSILFIEGNINHMLFHFDIPDTSIMGRSGTAEITFNPTTPNTLTWVMTRKPVPEIQVPINLVLTKQ